jgi:hypothetical protein
MSCHALLLELFFEAERQMSPDKPLAPQSQAQWQTAFRSFTCPPLGSNPEPFVVAGPQNGHNQ